MGKAEEQRCHEEAFVEQNNCGRARQVERAEGALYIASKQSGRRYYPRGNAVDIGKIAARWRENDRSNGGNENRSRDLSGPIYGAIRFLFRENGDNGHGELFSTKAARDIAGNVIGRLAKKSIGFVEHVSFGNLSVSPFLKTYSHFISSETGFLDMRRNVSLWTRGRKFDTVCLEMEDNS